MTQENFNEIIQHIQDGGAVVFSNYLHSYQFDVKNFSLLKFSKKSIYMVKGKKSTCFDFMAVRLYKLVASPTTLTPEAQK